MEMPQIKRSHSMEIAKNRSIDLDSQMEEVKKLIKATQMFNDDMIHKEIEYFYGPLGLHDFYFSGQSASVIAQHLQSLIAAKLTSIASGEPMDAKLEQESAKSAFFAVRSNVQGEVKTHHRENKKNKGPTEVEKLEQRLERHYLSGSVEFIGDGVKNGYQHLEETESSKGRTYRLQCYRSTGVLDPEVVPSHMRMYFLQEPDYVNPNPDESQARDIDQVADKVFLSRAGDRLKEVYQKCMITALDQLTPSFHTEVWSEPDGSKMARLTIAYRNGATHSYFSSIADVYRQHGLFSSRKYAEHLSNGVVVYGFYLQQLHQSPKGSGTFEERLEAVVDDASLHFVLPRTSLTPMLTENHLSPQEISYAYAAWKFTFHFMHRLPEAYTIVANSLRERDPSAFARLDELRATMKLNTYTESQILDHILSSASVVKMLYDEFQELHAPCGRKSDEQENMLSRLKKTVVAEQTLAIFAMFHKFNIHIKKTNFFMQDKAALSFRLDGEFLSGTEFPEKPYAVIFVIGSEFRGFHVRFLNISRGGIRMIRSSHAQVYLNNASSLFDECYNLASTQHRKNKDIPEGGSKGVILLNEKHQDKAEVAFRKYIDALMDIMLMNGDGVEEDILFLGPDEGTAHLMDWASTYAKHRGYSYWKAITTGKSASRGGIPHDVYGMTTHSVRQYVTGIQRKLELGKDRAITKVQTGGPDGDLGSNEIIMSEGENTIAIVDGSGVLYDANGIDRTCLLGLAKERKPIENFDMTKLNKDGYAVLVSQHNVTLPNGDIVENGTEFRNLFHLRQSLSADFFVPCGGRPAAVNLSNVDKFMYQEDGKTLRFKYIVEGANLFFTQDARLRLEDAGVVLFKDASANKGGVTSSSLEVLAALGMNDEEFGEHMAVDETTGMRPPFYAAYVEEVQARIDAKAEMEFDCIWREHERTGAYYCKLSDQLSERITELSVKIQDSKLWTNQQLREKVMKDGMPKTLLEKVSLETLMERLPESYTRSFFASQLASKFIYRVGQTAPEFAFYEFVEELLQN